MILFSVYLKMSKMKRNRVSPAVTHPFSLYTSNYYQVIKIQVFVR